MRVYLCKGDESGWAIDEDRALTAAALEGVATLVETPRDADVIHAVWWHTLMGLPARDLEGKRVVCHMAGRPARCLGEPAFAGAMSRVDHWIAQSREAYDELRGLVASVTHVPYAVDMNPGTGLGPSPQEPAARAPRPDVSRHLSRLPRGAYVIANFHRDSVGEGLSEGRVLPKLVKGPDLFVEILAMLRERGENVVALLAGPRRHWVRSALRERGVEVVFAGEELAGDDYPRHILPRRELARLYAAANLVLCTSRSEGGPRGVLEAAALGVPQLSTRVGLAPDVLHHECLFSDPVEGAAKIQSDIAHATLRRWAPAHQAIVRAGHSVEANRERFRALYAAFTAPAPTRAAPPLPPTVRGLPRRVSFWNKFTPPPWGGGNQFMMALKHEAQLQGIEAIENGEGPPATAHLLNSVQFDIEKFETLVPPGSARVVHRIDGPISVLRGTPESLDLDRRCFELNARYACATVIQSWYTVRALADMGFRPVRPVLITNASDPAIFHPPGTPHAKSQAPGSPVKVIATCWSSSPGKGAAIYEWMGRNLDPRRYTLTFVGNCPSPLPNWRVIPPLASGPLAQLLREHDVYVTASRNDPCSNALVEAMSCGLPALYLDSGGHPELASFGGLPFRALREIPERLDQLVTHHAVYRRLLTPAPLAEVCRAYLDLLFSDAPYRT